MILITGATGTTGQALVELLQEGQQRFRVFVRDARKAHELWGDTLDWVIGDLNNPESLRPALSDVEKLFLLSPADPRQVEQQGHAVDLAKECGVQQIVKLSMLGADHDAQVSLLRWHAQTEEQIEQTDLEYTFLRPHYYMQNIFGFLPSIREQDSLSVPMSQGKISLVDARDVARVAATVLTQSGHAGKTYEITGPESLSFAQICRTLSEVTEREIQYLDVPPREAERVFTENGVPHWLAEAHIDLYHIFSANLAATSTDTVLRLTGHSARTFQTFAQDHRALLNAR